MTDTVNSREPRVVPNSNQPHLTVWGRVNSVNVQKVLWCLSELDLAYERIDAGLAFGRNHEPDYLAMNPNGRIPTLVDGDFVLWESNSIMRYLALAYGRQLPLYPQAPKLRASVDRWLDWTLSTLQPVERPVFWGLVRTPVEARDMAAIQKDADAAAAEWQTPNWRRAASSQPIISPWPTLRSAPMPGAGSVSKASTNQGWRIWSAGSRSSRTGRDSGNSSRRR
jgi:glutathione S-transferase